MTQILTHTPLWVFALFFGLVYLGYLQSRTRQVSRGRLIVLPLAMLAWSLYSVWSTFDAHLTESPRLLRRPFRLSHAAMA